MSVLIFWFYICYLFTLLNTCLWLATEHRGRTCGGFADESSSALPEPIVVQYGIVYTLTTLTFRVRGGGARSFKLVLILRTW